MKFSELRSIGHNIADSFASGIGLLIGVYDMNIFGEARRSREGFITVDFLTGSSAGGRPSRSLARAIVLYQEALSGLCRNHGVTPAAFRELTARFSVDGNHKRFVVTVEDRRGRRAIDEYVGLPGRRLRSLDSRGRVRTARGRIYTPAVGKGGAGKAESQ